MGVEQPVNHQQQEGFVSFRFFLFFFGFFSKDPIETIAITIQRGKCTYCEPSFAIF